MKINVLNQTAIELIPEEGETQEEICLAVAVAATETAIGPWQIFPPTAPLSRDKEEYRKYLTSRSNGIGLRLEGHGRHLFEVYLYPEDDGTLTFNEIAYSNRTGNSGRGMLPRAHNILQEWKEKVV